MTASAASLTTMTNYHCISVIAKTATNPSDPAAVNESLPDFYHDGLPFWLLVPIDFAELKKNVKNAPEFSLITKTTHSDVDNKYLCLFFSPLPRSVASCSKNKLIHQFFSVDRTSNGTENSRNLDDLKPEPISIQNIYALLRQSHLIDCTAKRVSDENTPPGLGPTLRFYQNDAVNWMLDRELNVAYFPSEFRAIRCRSLAVDEYCIRGNVDEMELYYNPRTMEICDEFPGKLAIPSGGILADEMGLGKTVEMLALMLCNPAKIRNKEQSKKTFG